MNQFDIHYDLEGAGGSVWRYLIAATPRSGSHLLGHLMGAHGDLGSPHEYLHPGVLATWQERNSGHEFDSGLDFLDFIARRRTSSSGWFGVKAHWEHLAEAQVRFPDLTMYLFDRVVRIRRRDTLGQAISLVIASQTESWISFQHPKRQPTYDKEAITQALLYLTTNVQNWDESLAGMRIPTLCLDYEDLVAAPDDVILGVRSFLGVPPQPGQPREFTMPQRQGTRVNDEWRARYLAEAVT